MNQSKALIAILVLLLILSGGFYLWKMKTTKQTERATQTTEQPVKTDEIESIKDLIDGEYVFTSIDTSDWKTYQNEEMEVGFEMKIPKNWKLVNSYKDNEIKGVYLYFGKEGAVYSIPEGGESDSAILVLSSDRFNKKAIPIRDFLQKRKSGYGESVSSLSIDNVEAIVLGEKAVYFFKDDKAWTISFQLYYDPSNSIHINEHDIFNGMLKTFKFLE